MHHFFVTPAQIAEGVVVISGSEAHHMSRVLRMQIGEECTVSDGIENTYLCQVDSMPEKEVCLQIKEICEDNQELPCQVYLFQGLPKGDKMEQIIQKAVELGVFAFVPISMQNSVVKLKKDKAEKKVVRWQEIARSAAKQSKRGVIPSVLEVTSFQESLKIAKELSVILVPYEDARGMDRTRELLKSLSPNQSIGIFIGPEGGFCREEIEQLKEIGGQIMTLGKRILRTETAGIATLAMLTYQLEQ